MIYVKTHSGQQVLKERRGALTPRQRSAFILFDGKRTLAQVLEATAALGITEQDVRSMAEHGGAGRTGADLLASIDGDHHGRRPALGARRVVAHSE